MDVHTLSLCFRPIHTVTTAWNSGETSDIYVLLPGVAEIKKAENQSKNQLWLIKCPCPVWQIVSIGSCMWQAHSSLRQEQHTFLFWLPWLANLMTLYNPRGMFVQCTISMCQPIEKPKLCGIDEKSYFYIIEPLLLNLRYDPYYNLITYLISYFHPKKKLALSIILKILDFSQCR